jgi:vitamin B12 transporter
MHRTTLGTWPGAPPNALLCVMAAVTATSAGAQQGVTDERDVRPLTAITVIASPSTTNPASVFTLSRADFTQFAPATTVDILRQIPGASVDRSGHAGSVSSLYLRGGDPNWTAIFLDGVRINDPTNSRGGSVDLSFLDPGMIERMEVIRGPASAALGSDAISGAINIVTRAPADTREASADVDAGTRSYVSVGARAAGPVGVGAISVHAAATQSGEQIEGGGTRLRTLVARWRSRAELPGTLELAAHAYDADAHAFPDDSGGPEYAVLRAVERRHAAQQDGSIRYRWEASEATHFSTLVTLLHRDESDVSPGVAPGVRDPVGIPPNRSDTRFERQTLRFTGESAVAPWLRIALGAEYQNERGSSRGALDLGDFMLPVNFSLSRSTIAGFGEMQGAISNTTLVASLRLDHAGNVENVTSARLGVVHAVDAATELRANYGKGFKLPSFFSLSNPIVGNPGLVPERSRSIDAGWTHRFANGSGEIALALFRSRVEHAIDFDAGPPPRLVNRSAVESKGGEVALRFDMAPSFRVQGQVGVASAHSVGTDEPLRNRPHLQGTLGAVVIPAEAVEASLAVTYVGHNADSSIPTGARTLAGYARLDAVVSYRSSNSLRFTLAFDNVLDRSYDEMVGFPGPRRGVRLGVSAAL